MVNGSVAGAIVMQTMVYTFRADKEWANEGARECIAGCLHVRLAGCRRSRLVAASPSDVGGARRVTLSFCYSSPKGLQRVGERVGIKAARREYAGAPIGCHPRQRARDMSVYLLL